MGMAPPSPVTDMTQHRPPRASLLPHPPGAPPRRSAGEGGFTLVEIALALLVIAIATLGGVSWTLSGVSLDADTQETSAAHDVLRRLLEELQQVPFEELYPRYNADPQDDPDGVGTALGGAFQISPDRKEDFLGRVVGGLTNGGLTKGGLGGLLGGLLGGKQGPEEGAAQPQAVAGRVAYRKHPIDVRISFPVDESGRLNETALDGTWSNRTWDLDGDGSVSAGPIAATAVAVLPMRVQVSWPGRRGTQTVEHLRFVAKRNKATELP